MLTGRTDASGMISGSLLWQNHLLERLEFITTRNCSQTYMRPRRKYQLGNIPESSSSIRFVPDSDNEISQSRLIDPAELLDLPGDNPLD